MNCYISRHGGKNTHVWVLVLFQMWLILYSSSINKKFILNYILDNIVDFAPFRQWKYNK